MSSRAKWLFRWGFFPAVFFGALGAGVALVRGGWSPMVAVGAVTFSCALLIGGSEKVQPRFTSWAEPRRGDWKADLAHTFLSTLLPPEIIRAVSVGTLTGAAVWLSATVGASLWPHGIPLVLQLVLAMVVSEFGSYWVHRLMHEHELLWRLHSVHHSAERLYWLNAGRFHPLDTALQYVGQTFPLILLGAGPEVVALFSLWTAVHGMFQHANLDIRLGPLNWIFSMAELHRWHHSTLQTEGNTNYGANICFWDVVFGTRFLPSDREPPEEIGIGGMPGFPAGYAAHLAAPFRWSGVVEESREALPDQS
ncbi:MAG: sterol desaturase family protein [Deltaproteobacteria bacterium]|nr:sterol desaturase family protein [Deltaproteobacteria bacterium]